MKIKKNTCESCGACCEHTHLHHILPKSKGGSDLSSNLIEVCPSCHQKIHNVEFNGDLGIIKNGIQKTKEAEKVAKEFFDKHTDAIMLFCDDFYHEYGTEVLTEMMRFDVLDTLDFVGMLKGKKIKKSFGQIPTMVQTLYKSNPNKYGFVF